MHGKGKYICINAFMHLILKFNAVYARKCFLMIKKSSREHSLKILICYKVTKTSF